MGDPETPRILRRRRRLGRRRRRARRRLFLPPLCVSADARRSIRTPLSCAAAGRREGPALRPWARPRSWPLRWPPARPHPSPPTAPVPLKSNRQGRRSPLGKRPRPHPWCRSGLPSHGRPLPGPHRHVPDAAAAHPGCEARRRPKGILPPLMVLVNDRLRIHWGPWNSGLPREVPSLSKDANLFHLLSLAYNQNQQKEE